MLKKSIQNTKLDEVGVGSVEEFQGQENLVVIISTVRSSPEYLQNDKNYKIGFLSNPKVTRLLLKIVG